ncbi:MAG: HAD-IB family phosphatase [Thermoplasmata archaeon]
MKETVLAFDVDGVLLSSKSSWSTIHNYFGVNNGDSLRLYIENRISYDEFVERDVSLWLQKKGRIHYNDLLKISKDVIPNPNHEVLSEFLRKFSGKKIAISGGVDIIVNRIKDFYPIDDVHSNKLIFKDGYLVGGKAYVEPSQKGKILRSYDGKKISVGDSSWDRDMFSNSDYSILFNSDEDIEGVDLIIRNNDLGDLTRALNDLL